MFFGPILAAGLLAAASSNMPVPAAHAHITAQNNAVTVTATNASTHGVPDAPRVGDPAPDFSYQSHDFLWQNLHNILEQGSVLLVFGATEAQVADLEAEREDLLRQGVIPVAVFERRGGDVWSIVRRTRVSYSLLADPHGAISEQYGVLDPVTRHARASWFVIGSDGRVRGTGPGATSRNWTQVAAAALGRTDVQSASSH